MAIVMIHQTNQPTIDITKSKHRAGHVHFYQPGPPVSSVLQDVTSLILPFEDGVRSRDKGKGRADDVEEEPIEKSTADFDADTDEEEEDKIPVPQFINGAADGDEDDLGWASVPVPTALTEDLPEDLPEVLLEIARSSIDVLQNRVAEVIVQRAACAERAERAEAEAREEAAAQERATLAMTCSPKGKEKEEENAATPEAPTATAAAARRSRRRFFAARLFRHGYTHRGDEEGESSSAGAAASMTVVDEKDEWGTPTGKQWEKSSDGSWSLVLAPEPPKTETETDPTAKQEKPSEQPPVVSSTKETAPASVRKPEMIECVSCFDEIPAREAVKTPCHSYCLECFRQLITTALDNEAQFPPKCCLNEIPEQTIVKYVPRSLRKRYTAKADEFRVPVDLRLYCPYADCGLFVPPTQISRAAHIGRCRNGHETCTICRQAAHGTGRQRQPCPEDQGQRMADELAADEGWQRCIQCAVLVEHRAACQHMTCRCGAQFCYVCGAAWRTCSCTQSDLNRRKAGAAARRAARQAREREEAEAAAAATALADEEVRELRDALRLIEEFERAEAASLNERRTANRERLQAMRTQRESVLRTSITDKYAGLQQRLAALAAMQSAGARKQRHTERTNRIVADAVALADLTTQQTQQRAELAEQAQQYVRAAEQAWTRDWRARVVLEQQLEQAYEAELRGMLTETDNSPPSAEDEKFVDQAMRTYMRHNDARLDVYLQWRARELAAVRSQAEDERCVRAELLERTRRLAVETQCMAAAQQQQRHAAERMWVRAVSAQRQRQLTEMEALEQSLGLEGSTVDADVELLLLLELERNGEVDAADLELDSYYRNMQKQGILGP